MKIFKILFHIIGRAIQLTLFVGMIYFVQMSIASLLADEPDGKADLFAVMLTFAFIFSVKSEAYEIYKKLTNRNKAA